MTAQQTDATTDPQSIIAALQQRLDAGLAREAALAEALAARTAELAQRNTDYRERIEHQAATIDVLKVMSASPGDPEPVFDLIARQAAKLCEVPVAAVAMFDGTMIHLATQSGFDTAHAEMYVAQFPRPVGLDTTMGRAILNQRVEQVEDVAAEAGYTILQPPGPWSNMAVPLLRDGVPLGAIAVARPMTGAFSNSQIILLKTFAEQAVIAITSAETYRGLHEALEQQTATAEVLQVINAKPGDLAPVFDAMLEKALALCGSAFGTLNVFDGEMFHVVASRGLPAALANYFQKPITPAPGMTLHRVVLGEDIVHVADLRDDDAYRSRLPTRVALVDLGGARTQLIVSLRKDNRLIGVIMVYRTEVRSYTDKQIALLENFADQAVVAMENARLLGELRQRTADLQESLEYQTATSDVLKVISRSTFDLQPVLGTLVETAARLCAADFAMISNREGDGYREAATFSASPEWAASLHGRFLPENRGSVTGRAALERRAVQIADAASDSEYDLAGAVTVGETRSCVGVPLLREGIVVGVIALARRRVQPFTDKQIALVSTFADQAVIAIENVRLIAEQREALEQQTATAEVLQVINASPGNLTPVFDAILEKAVRLCQSAFGTLFTYDGQLIHFVAAYGITPEMMNLFREPRPPARGAPTGRIADGEPFVHVADATDQDIYRAGDRPTVAFVDQIGARTALFVGLRQDATLLGYLVIFRREVHAFSDKEIALVMNFAAQAVIAMENARLLTEQREALEQQTATAEVLQVINSSPGNLVPVFDAMLEKAMQLCEAAFGELGTYDGERFEVVALRGVPSPYAKYARGERKYGPGTGPALILEGERVVHVLDLKSTDVYAKGESARRAIVDLGGARTFLLVPLLKDENVVGFITIYRQEVRPFTEKQTSLLQSFAAQAVIAMDNARLLNEIRQRQSELRVTFDNMGDGVAMFDETPRLVAWNRKFQELLDVPDAILAERRTYADYIGYLTERGEFGADTDTETQLRRFQGHIREHYAFERTRPDGRVIEVRHNPVPDGGFVLIYTDITERKRSEAEIRAARDAAEICLS